MYPVSDSFLENIKSNTRNFFWSGSITVSDGTVYPIHNSDIVQGSAQIIRECTGSTEIEYGGVYAGELSITLYSDIDRYTLENAQITLFFHLSIGDHYETVPMGIFEVSEANRTATCLELRAYDYMLRFDKNFDRTFTSGSAYDFLTFACNECNVILGNTQEEIDAMPNATELLGLYAENDIESYRDLLHYLSQALGAFCMIDREGKLLIKRFGIEPIIDISSSERFSSSFSDFITRYSAIRITNLKLQESEYYALEPDEALTMELGSNPLLQLGLEETRLKMIHAVLETVQDINYLPFDCTTIGNPALDLGDCLTFSDGQADHEQISILTAITLQLNGKQRLKCVGKNPRLSQAKSKNDKNISGLLQSVGSAKTAVYNYINARTYTLSDTPIEIIRLAFTSNEDTNAQFFAEILFTVDAEPIVKTTTVKSSIIIDEIEHIIEFAVPYELPGYCELEVTYYFNGYPITTFLPLERYPSGSHILTLYYPIAKVVAKNYNTFFVSMRLLNSGTVTIGKTQIRATITGQGLASGEGEWDGRIEVFDEMALPRFHVGLAHVFHDSPAIHFPAETNKTFCDYMPRYINLGVSLAAIENTTVEIEQLDYEESTDEESDIDV